MKKLLINILIMALVFIPSRSLAVTLKGTVEKVWNVDSAREEVFKDAKPWVDLSQYPAIDPDYNENKKLINKNQLETKDRHITVFSDGWYAVKYDSSISESYYYNPDGMLKEIDFNIYSKNVYTAEDMTKYPYEYLFPAKVYKHSYPSGKIKRVGLRTLTDDFLYDPAGKLVQHCVAAKCYDTNGNLVMTRESE